MSKNNDKQVLALQEVVAKKKEAIAKAERPTWLTNCSLVMDDGSRLNLHVTKDLDQLSIAMGRISRDGKVYEEGRSLLGLTYSQFKENGYTFDEWKSDIQTRVAQIQISEEKAKLDTAQAALDKLLSKELKEKRELAELQELLK